MTDRAIHPREQHVHDDPALAQRIRDGIDDAHAGRTVDLGDFSQYLDDVDASGCPFCLIITGAAPATIVRRWWDAIAIEPLNPVVSGHVLIIPTRHVADFSEDPEVTAATMRRAAEFAADGGPCNLITSQGVEATQSVFHLHVHLIPRRLDDKLALPWHSGKHTRGKRS